MREIIERLESMIVMIEKKCNEIRAIENVSYYQGKYKAYEDTKLMVQELLDYYKSKIVSE